LAGMSRYGSVYKAKWRGTEVAVKVMSSEVVTKEMQRQFADEVRPLPPTSATLHCRLIGGWCNDTRPGAHDDGVAASERGAVHGGVHKATQDVHRHGAHVSRLSLRGTLRVDQRTSRSSSINSNCV
jgi:hypothetical protein